MYRKQLPQQFGRFSSMPQHTQRPVIPGNPKRGFQGRPTPAHQRPKPSTPKQVPRPKPNRRGGNR